LLSVFPPFAKIAVKSQILPGCCSIQQAAKYQPVLLQRHEPHTSAALLTPPLDASTFLPTAWPDCLILKKAAVVHLKQCINAGKMCSTLLLLTAVHMLIS